MARGLDAVRAREAAVSRMGRALARRCRSKCELCEAAGVSLKVIEVEPLPESPDEDHAIMICEICQGDLTAKKLNDGRLRFLEGLVWSEIPAVQVSAVRLLQRLQKQGVEWAIAVLDGIYLDPAIEAWVQGDIGPFQGQ